MVKVKRKRKPIEKPKKPLAKKMALIGAGGLAALGVSGKAEAKIAPSPVARVRVVVPAKEIEKEKREVKEREAVPTFQTYTVEKGDSLWKISQKFYQKGLAWPVVFNANKNQIKNPNLIIPGQKLAIPDVEITDSMLQQAAQKANLVGQAASILADKVEKTAPTDSTASQNIGLSSSISQLTVFDQSLISQTLTPETQPPQTITAPQKVEAPPVEEVPTLSVAAAEAIELANAATEVAKIALSDTATARDTATASAAEAKTAANDAILAAETGISNQSAVNAANAGAAKATVAAAKAAETSEAVVNAAGFAIALTTITSEPAVVSTAQDAAEASVAATKLAHEAITSASQAVVDAAQARTAAAGVEAPSIKTTIPAARFEESDIEAIFGSRNPVASIAAAVATSTAPVQAPVPIVPPSEGGGEGPAPSVSPAVSISTVTEEGPMVDINNQMAAIPGTSFTIGTTNQDTTGANITIGNVSITGTMSNDLSTVTQSITVDQQTVNTVTTFNDDGTVNITTIGPNIDQTQTVTLSKSEVDAINQQTVNDLVDNAINTLANQPRSSIVDLSLTVDQQLEAIAMRDEAIAFQQAQQQAMQQEVDAAIAAADAAVAAAATAAEAADALGLSSPSAADSDAAAAAATAAAAAAATAAEAADALGLSSPSAADSAAAADAASADAASAAAADAEGDASVSAPDSASEGEAGNIGPTGDTSDASADADADAGDSGGGGGDGGGTVICTELYRQGILDNKTYLADIAFGAGLSEDVLRGYRIWGKKLAKIMAKSQLITMAVSIFALPWTKEMAYRMGGRKKGHFFGKLMNMVGIPICKLIGKIVK